MESIEAFDEENSAEAQMFMSEVLNGLTSKPKTLPCKYFYDKRGSELFDKICELPEYYPTRVELEIMQDFAGQMADMIGPEAEIIEMGSGSSLKTRLLLEKLDNPTAYVPVDISAEHLEETVQDLSDEFPEVPVMPVAADFTRSFDIPEPPNPPRKEVIYFPGSTIGNFKPRQATKILSEMGDMLNSNSGLLIGVDLRKQKRLLETAYNDEQGVTAEFNLNLLRRIKDELKAQIDLDAFEHQAFFNERESRIEMHLVSKTDQQMKIDGTVIKLQKGESIHTENSYKYDLSQFAKIADNAGFKRVEVWTDAKDLFSVQYFRRT